MKYKIPNIKPIKFDVYCRMNECCNEANTAGSCDDIVCGKCLFFTDDVTAEQEKQFLQWEKQQEAK